jgi:hypothetical protein
VSRLVPPRQVLLQALLARVVRLPHVFHPILRADGQC